MHVLGEDTPSWLFRECKKYLINECRDLQAKKRFALSFQKLGYGTVVRENMRLVLKILAPNQVVGLQSEIFDDVKRWLSTMANEWTSTANTTRSQNKTNASAPKLNDERRMHPPPHDLMQWANDAFHYAESRIVAGSEKMNEESSTVPGDGDFLFLVSLAMLVLKMHECSKSEVDGNITSACNQHAVCSSYASSGSRWIFTLTEFPFA